LTRQAAYELFTPNKSGQRSRPTSYRGCWHVVGRRFFHPYRHHRQKPAASSRSKEVYNPKAFIPHAASLRQASAHCAIFPTAASRRSLGRVSVPVWPDTLSGRLPVNALVGHHPTNKLIGREPIPYQQKPFHPQPCNQESYPVLAPVSEGYPRVEGRSLTCYSPVRRSSTPEGAFPHDLHVLSTPPAFVLSQDQTLQQKTKPWQTIHHRRSTRQNHLARTTKAPCRDINKQTHTTNPPTKGRTVEGQPVQRYRGGRGVSTPGASPVALSERPSFGPGRTIQHRPGGCNSGGYDTPGPPRA
jgi:hypothetical protein